MKSSIFSFLILVILISSCKSDDYKESEAKVVQVLPANPAELLWSTNHQQILQAIPELNRWKKNLKEVLAQKEPIYLLEKSDLINPKLFFAQAMAVSNPSFISQTHLKTGAPVLSMVTDIRLAESRELRLEKLSAPLVVVEMYNYYFNTVYKAFIDEAKKEVVRIGRYPGTHPTLRKELKTLAPKIALAYPIILDQLGVENQGDLEGATIDIRDSKCERSRHLCSAVLVTKKGSDKTLWVLVDLTTLEAIGYQWLPIFDPKRPVISTERSLQNKVVMDTYCGDTLSVNLGKWHINYTLTQSDGVEIFDVSFNNAKVLNSAKIVDWHVSYPDKKNFGYSDAMGCPQFSSAAVVAFGGPDTQRIIKNGNPVGYSLVQDFRSPVWPKGCNYRYQNLFEFYDDGRFRIAGVNLGLGCSTNGWYRPVFRIDLEEGDGQIVSQWNETRWVEWTKENWHLQKKATSFSSKGYLFKFQNKNGHGFYLEPNQGQFQDGSHGDNAFTYISVNHRDKDEGESDMSTFGDCCNTDFRQGPEVYISPAEPLTGASIIWYVPQMKNNAKKGNQYCWVESYVKDGYEGFRTYPGIVGPMFVPIKK